MPKKNILKEMGQSITGAVSKAIIEIHDERVAAKEIVKSETEAKSTASLGLGGASEKIKKAAEKAAETAEDIVEAVKTVPMTYPSATSKKVRFEVMFNPSQLSFRGIGGGRVSKTNFSAGNSVKLDYQEMKPRIEMHVQLIFDDMERTEAFRVEKLTDPTAMIRSGVERGVSKKLGKTHDVRTQVEGFLAVLRSSCTRKFTFYWGNMKYTGVFTYVNAEYTMFSTDGKPVRAVVNLSGITTDESLTDNYMGQWQDGYKKLFGDGYYTKTGSVMQNVENVLNVKL